MPLYILLLFILFHHVFILHRVFLYVNVRMNMYVMFLLRQRRLNKLIIIIYTPAPRQLPPPLAVFLYIFENIIDDILFTYIFM